MVRSSMMSIGAASEPARSSRAVSVASMLLMRPEICTRPPPISVRMTGAVTTSPLPFSISRMAMRLPTFSRVMSLKMRAPAESRVRCTAGSCVWLSKPGWASVRRSPVSTTCFLTSSGWPPRSVYTSVPNGGLPASAASSAPGESLTMRISRVAVRPRMSLALAVSWTPGSWTTMRSEPCCWITGSATPSSLIRLCSVVMFCLSANSPIFFWASGFSVATSLRSLPSPCSARAQIGLAVGDGVACLVARLGIAELDDQAVALAVHAGVTQVLVAHDGAQVGRHRVEALGQRALHVDLEQEMHAAAQVKAEVHRQRVQRGQPARGGRKQIERDDVLRVGGIRVEGFLQHVLGLQLDIRVREAGLDAVEVELDAVVRDAGGLQGLLDARQSLLVDLDRRLGARNLNRRRFAEEIGQGVGEAQHERDSDGDVLPEWVAIHSGFKAKRRPRAALRG